MWLHSYVTIHKPDPRFPSFQCIPLLKHNVTPSITAHVEEQQMDYELGTSEQQILGQLHQAFLQSTPKVKIKMSSDGTTSSGGGAGHLGSSSGGMVAPNSPAPNGKNLKLSTSK